MKFTHEERTRFLAGERVHGLWCTTTRIGQTINMWQLWRIRDGEPFAFDFWSLIEGWQDTVIRVAEEYLTECELKATMLS